MRRQFLSGHFWDQGHCDVQVLMELQQIYQGAFKGMDPVSQSMPSHTRIYVTVMTDVIWGHKLGPSGTRGNVGKLQKAL